MSFLSSHFQEAEIDAELLALDDAEANIGHMPEDFISIHFLEHPGDYCISLTEAGLTRVSVKSEAENVYHLLIQKREKWGLHLPQPVFSSLHVRGLLHGSGESVGELLYSLREPSCDLLSYIFESKISFSRLIRLGDLRSHRFLQNKNVRGMKPSHRTNGMIHYEAEVELGGGWVGCELWKATELGAVEWRQKMFEEMRVSVVAEERHLPIRRALAIVVADEGYLVYKKLQEMSLDVWVGRQLDALSVYQRIRLMLDVVSVMADLHLAKIYHGALELSHFFIEDNSNRVLFNSADGLVPMAVEKTVTLANFRNLAPEVAWTRRLTPATGVYSLGRMLQCLSDMKGQVLARDPNAQQLHSVARLVSSCLHRRPVARPTMDGVFLRLQEAFVACKPSDQK